VEKKEKLFHCQGLPPKQFFTRIFPSTKKTAKI
jgi:hypothetical protein